MALEIVERIDDSAIDDENSEIEDSMDSPVESLGKGRKVSGIAAGLFGASGIITGIIGTSVVVLGTMGGLLGWGMFGTTALLFLLSIGMIALAVKLLTGGFGLQGAFKGILQGAIL